jgi:hypothetical protein
MEDPSSRIPPARYVDSKLTHYPALLWVDELNA